MTRRKSNALPRKAPPTKRRRVEDSQIEDPTPYNADYLSKTLASLSDYVKNEAKANTEQIQTIVVTLDLYVKSLADTYHVKLPKGFQLRVLPSTDSEIELTAEDSSEKNTGINELSEEADVGSSSDNVQSGNPTTIHDACSDKLEKIRMALSAEADKAALEVARDKFYKKLERLEVEVTKDNKVERQRFSKSEAVEITNFFFADMMGPKAATRLQALLRSYTADYNDGIDRGAGARAEAAAKDEANITTVRSFFDAFARTQRSRPNLQGGLAAMEQIMLHVELLSQFNQLKTLAAAKDTALLSFLRDSGYKTSRGLGWQSCVINFLANSIHISPSVLQNTCQMAQGVMALIEIFGPGIIPVLPTGVMTKLNRWGNQRMASVYSLLKTQAPFISPICTLLEEHLYQPIKAGQPILIGQIKTGIERPLLERISEAVGEGKAHNAGLEGTAAGKQQVVIATNKVISNLSKSGGLETDETEVDAGGEDEEGATNVEGEVDMEG